MKINNLNLVKELSETDKNNSRARARILLLRHKSVGQHFIDIEKDWV